MAEIYAEYISPCEARGCTSAHLFKLNSWSAIFLLESIMGKTTHVANAYREIVYANVQGDIQYVKLRSVTGQVGVPFGGAAGSESGGVHK